RWHFNQSMLLRFRESPDPAVLRECARLIADHHTAFRLRYRRDSGEWLQSYAADGDVLPLEIEDLRHLPASEQSAALEARATAWQRSLDLDTGPLSRFVLFQLNDAARLLWCAHHLIVDGVSWRILLGDLTLLLDTARRGAPLELPPRSAPFSTWARYL